MKRNGNIVSKENQLIRKSVQMVDKKELLSGRKPNVHGWDDGKIYFWDGEKENCVSDYPELIDFTCKNCSRKTKSEEAEISDLL